MLGNLKCKLFGYSRRKDMKRKVIATSLLIFSLSAIPSMAKISACGGGDDQSKSENKDDQFDIFWSEKYKDKLREKLWNLRDLGGLETENGQKTFKGAFLRSGVPTKLDKPEIEAIKNYGVRTVIDLRTDSEIKRHYSCLSNVSNIDYHNIIINYCDTNEKGERLSVSETYTKIIENKGNIKQVFDKIIEAKEGTIFFNCYAGRDRTGIISMIILGLAGVKKEDIIKDYLKTFDNIRSDEKYKAMSEDNKKKILPFNDEELKEEFEKVIQHISVKYTSFQGYLKDCGMSEGSIKKVRERII